MNAFKRPGVLPTKMVRTPPAWQLLLATGLTWGLFVAWYWVRAWWQDGSGVLAAGQKVAAQWPLDAATAASFAFRPPEAWLMHPLAADAPLGGDFAASALAAPLLALGIGPGIALMASGLLIALLFLAALVLFARSLLDSNGLAWLAATLLLAAGGLGFADYFQDLLAPLIADDPSWGGFTARLAIPPFNYTVRPLHGVLLGTPLLHELAPHRELMLGIAATLPLLLVLFTWHRTEGDGTGLGWPLLLGLVAGLLPAIDATALLVFLLGLLCIAACCPVVWRHWLAVLVGVAAAAAPLLYLLHDGWQPLLEAPRWLPGGPALEAGADTPTAWLTFWWHNRGLFLPMALIGMLLNRWWQNPMALAGAVLFALLNLVALPRWLGDAGELLVWSQLLLALPVAALLRDTIRTLPLGSIPVALLIVALTASGGLDLWRAAGTRDTVQRIWGPDEVAVAEQLRSLPHPAGIVLATPRAAHWVAGLAGRPVIGSAPRRLRAAGLPPERNIAELFAEGAMLPEQLQQRDITYVAFGPSLGVQSGIEAAYARRYPEVVNGLRWRVYRVAKQP